MRIISRKTLIEYINKNKQSENTLLAWYHEVKKSNWNTPEDIKIDYPNASFLAKNIVIFNIKGNSYRLVVSVFYKGKQVYIKFIGTHAEYDKYKFTK